MRDLTDSKAGKLVFLIVTYGSFIYFLQRAISSDSMIAVAVVIALMVFVTVNLFISFKRKIGVFRNRADEE